MSFPRYPAYKHSRIEQLGDVPEHWEVVPVKRCLKSITQGWSPQCENYPADVGQWGVLKVGCVNGGSFDPSENKALPSALEPLPDLSIRRGDVLVSRANTRELVGSVAVAKRDYEWLMLCDKLYRLRVDEQRCDAAFLANSLSTPAARGVIEAAASGASSSMLNIGQAAITGMFIAVPPLKEQQALVAFVQNEAAKIDALAEEQRCLIELLKEKRQAVISQAVTKGLNPNVPMKDSEVEWLGKVPAHWRVLPCRAIVTEQTAKNEGAKCQDYLSVMANVGVIPYAEKGDVGNKAPEDLSKCKLVAAGDIVINSMNYGIGSFGLSPLDGVCSPVYVILRPNNAIVETRFAFRLFAHRVFQTYAQSFGNGILAHRAAIGWDTLKAIGVPVPPAEEQVAILQAVDSQTEKFDSLIAVAESGVALLKERRSALISAAVTGMIDVRGLVPQPEAVAA
jgi:type I restriction enzyme S subunit